MVYRSGPPETHFRAEREMDDGAESPDRFIDARALEAIDKGQSGPVMLLYRSVPDEPGEEIGEAQAFNRFGDVSQHAQLLLKGRAGKWLIVMAECSPEE